MQRRVQDEAALNEFVDTLRSAKRIPKDKYSYPMTSSQEYGWDIEDEVRGGRQDEAKVAQKRHARQTITQAERMLGVETGRREKTEKGATTGAQPWQIE